MSSTQRKQIVGGTLALALTFTLLSNVAESDAPDFARASHVQTSVNTASVTAEGTAYPAVAAYWLYRAATAYRKWYRKHRPFQELTAVSGPLALQTLD
jgi:hypothetical protein